MRTNPAARGLAVLPLVAMLPLLSGSPPESPLAQPEVCVIAPRTEADRDGQALATVPLDHPTIFVREPLARVRLLRGAIVLWERQAGMGGPIQGPIAWPLPALRPDESLRLLLQPAGAGPADFAEIRLRAANSTVLGQSRALLQGLRTNATAWQRAVERALETGDAALVTALLFAFEGPSSPDLDALRLEAFAQSCRQAPSP